MIMLSCLGIKSKWTIIIDTHFHLFLFNLIICLLYLIHSFLFDFATTANHLYQPIHPFTVSCINMFWTSWEPWANSVLTPPLMRCFLNPYCITLYVCSHHNPEHITNFHISRLSTQDLDTVFKERKCNHVRESNPREPSPTMPIFTLFLKYNLFLNRLSFVTLSSSLLLYTSCRFSPCNNWLPLYASINCLMHPHVP